MIVAVAVTGTLMGHMNATAAHSAPASRILTYLPMILVSWGLVFYVSRFGRPRSALRHLLGSTWGGPGRALADLGLALSLGIGIGALDFAWRRLTSAGVPASAMALLPHTGLERAVWVIVAVSVGFSEEVVYRGYFQAQLTALTGRAGVAIALQAVLFGVAHGEQGLGAMARVAVYGMAFGALAWWRRSLVPGILCHVGIDLGSGLLHH